MDNSKTQWYDTVIMCLFCNIHHFAKAQSWSNDDHKLFLAVAIRYSEYMNKPIKLDASRKERAAISEFFRNNNWDYFKSVPKVPNKQEMKTCLDVRDILMFTETGLNKEMAERGQARPDWTFADIWREYYAPVEEKVI